MERSPNVATMSYEYTHFFASHQQTPDASACGVYTELEASRQRQRCHTHTEKGVGVTLTPHSPQLALQQGVLPLPIIFLSLNVKGASVSRAATLYVTTASVPDRCSHCSYTRFRIERTEKHRFGVMTHLHARL